jgi:hypothetical protein
MRPCVLTRMIKSNSQTVESYRTSKGTNTSIVYSVNCMGRDRTIKSVCLYGILLCSLKSGPNSAAPFNS